MRVIISGSDDFRDYETLRAKMDIILSRVTEPVSILTGGNRLYDWNTGDFYGTDYLAEKYAREKGYSTIVFPLEAPYDIKAIIKRNSLITSKADALVIFQPSPTQDNADLLAKAEERGLKVRVVRA
jgi:hypothetical protein